MERPEEEFAAYDRVMSLYGDRPEAALAEQVARSFVGGATTLWKGERTEEALEKINRLEERFGDSANETVSQMLELVAGLKSAILEAENEEE